MSDRADVKKGGLVRVQLSAAFTLSEDVVQPSAYPRLDMEARENFGLFDGEIMQELLALILLDLLDDPEGDLLDLVLDRLSGVSISLPRDVSALERAYLFGWVTPCQRAAVCAWIQYKRKSPKTWCMEFLLPPAPDYWCAASDEIV